MRLKQFKFTDIIISIILTLLLLSVAVIFTLNFKPLYYWSIDHLDIAQTSGYSKGEIIDKYKALIEYNSPFYNGELSFPSLPSSAEGIQHFVEVKDIFIAFYFIALTTFVVSIVIILYKHNKRDYNYLLVSSIMVIILPLIVGTLLFLDFDTTFRVFHEIFFDNDYWLFDPLTDPVINILPSNFFLYCALLIIFFVILGSIILFISYKALKKRTGIKYRKNRGLNI
jgi:integral membrane protein (TIGR01906 family)